MSKIKQMRARKEYSCDKCEQAITRGTTYAFHHTSRYLGGQRVAYLFRAHIECVPWQAVTVAELEVV